MRKIRLLLKIVAFSLAVILIVQILPLSTISTAINNDAIVEQSLIKSAIDKSPEIIGEVESLRDEYTKHFRCEDGSFVAAVYNTPVHYQKNGEWKDIDNTLVANSNNNITQTSSVNSVKYAIKETSIPITFPESINNGKITITNNNNVISFGIKNNISSVSSVATVSAPEELASSSIVSLQTEKETLNIEENNMKLVADTQNSAITYANAFENASVEYEISSSIIKESIVVSAKSDSYRYEFTIDFGSYIPIADADGGINIYETAQSTEPVMAIASPYMFDADNKKSDAVTMELIQNAKDYTLVIEADKSWINKLGRKFPVVIDPTFILDLRGDNIDDAHINQNAPNRNYHLDYQLEVGKNNNNVFRTYIKYNLPTLPDCSVVTDADIKLTQNWYRDIDTTDLYVNVYKCNSNWNEDTITWNNQPISNLSEATIIDYTNYKNGMSTEYNLDITKIVKDWYENGNNHGLMLASSDETVEEKTSFYSSENLVSLVGDVQPVVTIQYVNNTGIEDYWTYDGFSLGKSGSSYINTYNGALTYIHNDVSTNGLLAPLNISHVYLTDERNADGTFGNMKFGKGFKLSVIEKIEAVDSDVLGSDYPYKLIDADGTVHFFVKSSTVNRYYYEFGSDIILTKNSSGYVLTSPNGSKKEFNSDGYLTKTTDNNGNSITITYSGGRITKVIDGGGVSVNLSYNSDNTLNYISDSTGRKTYYSYNSSGQLDYITYPDSSRTDYSYGSNSLLSEILAPGGAKAQMTYKPVVTVGNTFYRVSSYTTYGEDSSTVYDTVTLEYRTSDTYIKNTKGDNIVLAFDNSGRVINKIVNGKTALATQYNSSGNLNNTVSFASNAVDIGYNTFIRDNIQDSFSTEWEINSDGTTSNVIEESTERTNIHKKSLKVQRRGTTAGTITAEYPKWYIEPNETYTISMYVNIVDTLACGEVYLKATACETDGPNAYEITSVSGSPITTTDNQWQLITVTMTAPANTGAFIITCGLYNALGTVYFDALQVEKAGTPSKMNLLYNGNMQETNSNQGAEGWNGNYDGASDFDYDSDGNGYLWIKGIPTWNRSFSQDVDINGKAGDILVFGASAKAMCSSSGNDGTRFFGIQINLYSDALTIVQSQRFEFNEQAYDTWQTIIASVKANQDYVCAELKLCYFYEVNTAWFDNAFMYRDYYGTSYSYNSNGRVLTAKSDNGQTVKYNRSNGIDISSATALSNGVVTQTANYYYDANHNLLDFQTNDDIITAYTYNSKGLPLTASISDANNMITSEVTYTYTADNNYLKSVTDAAGGTTEYTYNSRGLVSKVTDPNGNITEYEYDPLTDAVISVTNPSAELGNPITEFEYDSAGRVEEINTGEFSWLIGYDTFGRKEGVQNNLGVGLSYNAYDENSNPFVSCLGNNEVEYTYDEDNRLTGEIHDSVLTYEYVYSNDGMLGKVIDHESDDEWSYQYDLMNRPTVISSNDGRKIAYEYNTKNELSRFKVTQSGAGLLDTAYTYDEKGRPTQTQIASMSGTPTQEYHYDILGRNDEFKNYYSGTNYVQASYTYKIAEDNNQTGQVQNLTYFKNNSAFSHHYYSYSYDANGNITHIYNGDTLLIKYHYDGLNRLAREDNRYIDKTVVYCYDEEGDILSKTEYNLTFEAALGEPIDTITCSYSDGLWRNGITSYDGEIIYYDIYGNPTSYRGYSMEWVKGRQLSTVSDDELSMQFKYNQSGIRTSKTVNGVKTEYTYVGDLLVSQKTGGEVINFAYTAGGAPLGFTYNGTPYFYLLNLQGDVIAVYDSTGEIVIEYTYDSWGKLISSDGPLAGTIGIKNPIRYRGYYYDVETGLYYLQSRYYDPETGRFINPDAYLIAGDDVLQGTNMYAYCYNNPVMYIDPSGMASEKDLSGWLGGLWLFAEMCYYFGLTNWIPGLSNISGEIVDFQVAIYDEFSIGDGVASFINFVNDAAVGAVVGAIVSSFMGSGVIAGVFTKLKKWIPGVAAGVSVLSETKLSEFLGSLNIFSNVAPGKYVLMSFLFMEEGKNYEYIPHIYYVLKFLGPDIKEGETITKDMQTDSSLEFMIYQIGFN